MARPSKSPARSRSPARTRSTRAAASARSPTPTKKAPTPKTTPKSKKAATKSPAAAPAAAAKQSPPSSAATAAKKAPAGGNGRQWSATDWVLLVALIGAVFSAIGMPSRVEPPKLPKVTRLSPQAFEGKNLIHKSGYSGSALVAFVDPKCSICKSVKGAFQEAQASLTSASSDLPLRFASVDCTKQYELCERFGVTGDTPDAMGTPYILWFRAGSEQGAYDGQRTAGGVLAWANEKHAAGQLEEAKGEAE